MGTTFDFNSNSIRVIDRDGSPWSAVADICRVLGISNTSDATNYLDQTEVNRLKLTAGRGPSNLIISESGLYKLVLRSDKRNAKPFQDWVTKVVLPAIRKDGAVRRPSWWFWWPAF